MDRISENRLTLKVLVGDWLLYYNNLILIRYKCFLTAAAQGKFTAGRHEILPVLLDIKGRCVKNYLMQKPQDCARMGKSQEQISFELSII